MAVVRILRVAVGIPAILLAGCTTMKPPLPPEPEAPAERPLPQGHGDLADRRLGTVDAISFSIASWGYPMERFEIASDGTGAFGHAPQERAEPVMVRFNAGPEGFERIRTVLQPTERYTAEEIPCGNRATDFPYGGVIWRTGGSSARLSFDLGCLTPEMRNVERLMREAVSLAEGFARDHPVR